MCLTPYIVRHKMDGNIPVPCGKCPICLKRRISSWSFRLNEHFKHCISAHGVTLTYAPAFMHNRDTIQREKKEVTITRVTKNNMLTLNRYDAQLFFKRLRKLQDPKLVKHAPIKYYLCGEYGGTDERPHFHAVIFNSSYQHIEQSWIYGSVHFAEPRPEWVGYTLKYMSKEKRIPMHDNDFRLREFALMSKGLGLPTSGLPP